MTILQQALQLEYRNRFQLSHRDIRARRERRVSWSSIRPMPPRVNANLVIDVAIASILHANQALPIWRPSSRSIGCVVGDSIFDFVNWLGVEAGVNQIHEKSRHPTIRDNSRIGFRLSNNPEHSVIVGSHNAAHTRHCRWHIRTSPVERPGWRLRLDSSVNLEQQIAQQQQSTQE